VTIFFGAGVSPNNGISVGLQEEAVKISERIMSLSLSLRYGDDLCFVSRADGQIYEYFTQVWLLDPCNHEITLAATIDRQPQRNTTIPSRSIRNGSALAAGPQAVCYVTWRFRIPYALRRLQGHYLTNLPYQRICLRLISCSNRFNHPILCIIARLRTPGLFQPLSRTPGHGGQMSSTRAISQISSRSTSDPQTLMLLAKNAPSTAYT